VSGRPRILAVANRKGGTAKTTTAVNVAAEWAAAGRRVLLVDLDPQGHATLGAGAHPAPDHPGLRALLGAQPPALDPLLVPAAEPGVWVLPPGDPLAGPPAGTDPGAAASWLRREAARLGFERVVIDTPPDAGAALKLGLLAADHVVVPFVPHPLAAEGVRQMARLFYRIATRANAGLRLAGLVPVMLDRRLREHRRVVAELAGRFGAARLLRGVRASIRVAESLGRGLAVRRHAPRSGGALDYALLAGEIELAMG